MLFSLPPHPGLLPIWLFIVAATSFSNAIQAYQTLAYTRRLYAPTPAHADPSTPNPEVTRLSSRTFGTWTFMAGVIRLYAAYNIDDKRFYDLALWTYGIALAHLVSEWAIFRTARLWSPWAVPAGLAVGSLTWMLWVKDDYVK